MRRLLLPVLAMALVPVAASAQDGAALDRRVTVIEKQLKAVQRKVFPGSDSRFFEAEIQPQAATPAPAPGIPASNPVSDLSMRVDTLEKQITTLTGQVEQYGYRLRQLEAKVTEMSAGATPPAPAPGIETGGIVGATPTGPATPVARPGTPAPPAAALPADPIEAAYLTAMTRVEAKDYGVAETQLKAFVAANPKHRRASHAQFWLGRSYLAEKKYNLAAEAFLANYQTNPRGERAPDSLLWLGRTLVDLKKPTEACRVFGELEDVYGAKMASDVRDQMTKARATAKCAA